MNTARLNFTRLNTSVLNASLLNSSLMGGKGKGSSSRPSGLIAQYKPYLNSNDSPTRDVLKDYSGHGNDVVLHNFAFAGMSGYGGYNWNFYLFNSNYPHTSSKVIIDTGNLLSNTFEYLYGVLPVGSVIPGAKVKVTGITGNGSFSFYNLIMSKDTQVKPDYNNIVRITNDGEYELSDLTITEDWDGLVRNTIIGFKHLNQITNNAVITIEQLPLYPGALVSDGVDDYGSISKPLGNVGTVIFMLDVIKWDKSRYLHNSVLDEQGNRLYCWKYNEHISSGLPATDTEIDNHFITFIREPQYVDSSWVLFSSSSSSSSIKTSVALYALEIYDRDLTEEEIEQVKQRMMAEYEKATGNILEPTLDPSLVDAWIFSGLKNYDAPEFITGEKGIQLEAHNFAWNEEGSGFKDGALWFDGVDDFLTTIETIIAKEDRFTIICKRNIHTTSNHNAIISNNASWTNNHPKFAFESRGNNPYVVSNGKTSIIEEGFPETISWMTDSSYNGVPIDNVSDILNYQKGMVVAADSIDWNRGSVDMNIYYFAIYRSALTEPQIQSEIQKLETLWSNRLNN